MRLSPWRAPAVGDEIDSLCRRCGEETSHRVVAMLEGKVHLVICRRCGNQHRFRPSLRAKGKKIPLPTARQARIWQKLAAPRQPKSPLKEWTELKELAGKTPPRPYRQSCSYQENQPIQHPSFGLGFVRRRLGAARMEVVFQYQIKILVMNRP